MNRLALLGACAVLAASLGADAAPNPVARPGLDRALIRMNAQGLAHQQATVHPPNPVQRPDGAATPAVPATPATPPPPGSGGPATPATPAVPAKPPGK